MKDVRPTSGKVLQALFSILGPVHGLAFLDLFAGTGRVAMKAWQSGASPVVAVEKLRSRCTEIPRHTRGTEAPMVLYMDIRRSLDWLSRKGYRFDVIFADPPYLCGWMDTLVPLLAEKNDLLEPGGVIVIEHSSREPLPAGTEQSFSIDERKYGETQLAFLRPVGENIDRSEVE